MYCRYEQQFEKIASQKNFTANEKDLNEKKRTLRNLDHQIRWVVWFLFFFCINTTTVFFLN